MDAKQIADLEARGCRVITGNRYCIVDKGHDGQRRNVGGLDRDGEPMRLNETTCVVIGVSEPCKVYYGETLEIVKQKASAKAADLVQGEIEDEEDVFASVVYERGVRIVRA